MTINKLPVKQNLLYNSAGTMFYLLCQWLITVLVVKLSSYTDAGNLSLAISITNVFFTIATFGIRNFQVSDIENKYSPSFYVTIRIVTGSTAFVLCMVFVFLNASYSAEQMFCIIIYMLFRLSEAFVDVFQAIQQKAYRMDYTAKSFIMRGTLLLLSFCSVLAVSKSLLLAIGAMSVLTMGVVIFYDIPVCRKLAPYRISMKAQDFKAIFLECWPLMFNSLMISSIVSIPRYFLEQIYGNEALGFYSSVATPAVIVQAACLMIYSPLVSAFAENYKQKNKKGYYAVLVKTVGAILGIFIIVLAGAALLGDWGLNLLFGSSILPYAYLLIPVLATTILIALCYFTDMLLTICRRLKTILFSNICAVTSVLLLSTILIRQFQMDGVNYVLYIGLGLNLILQTCFLLFHVRKHFKKQEHE